MVFTVEQDAFILMAHFRSGNRNANGTWTYSLRSCIAQFNETFPNVNIDYTVFANHKNRIIKRFEEKNCICKGKSTGRPSIVTDEVVNDIQHRMNVSPNKSVAKLSAETGLSVGTCHKVLKKNLHMTPYKISVHQLQPPDYEQRIHYCQWFNNNLNDDNLLDRTFFSDEAWFHLSGYVNSQNFRTWASENPHTFIETPLHPIKVGVWVAMSRRRIIGPIFFHDTINAERYRTIIIDQFLENLHDDEYQEGYFQQDGAPPHTAAQTLRYIEQFYDNRVISRGLWPSRSPDLTPLDFYLFGRIKNNIYKNRIHHLDQLQQAIEQDIRSISVEELVRVFDNMKRRINLCLESQGNHFQHLM